MKVLFHVDFFLGNRGGSLGFARLETELPFAPHLDMEFEQPVWKSPRKPLSVSWNLEDESFYIVLQDDQLPSEKAALSHAEMYRSHGWTVRE